MAKQQLVSQSRLLTAEIICIGMCRLQAGALLKKNLQETTENTNQWFQIFTYK